MAVAGLVTLCNLALSLVVGLRLLRARGRGPELALGLYFLASAFLSTICQGLVYGGLVDPRLVLAEGTSRLVLGLGILGMAVGAVGVLVFTRRTFRPERGWARIAVLVGGSVALGGWAYEGLAEGFAVSLVPKPGHWMAWAGRTFPMAWVAAESFRYWVLQRRRLRFGLAEPIVANRFLLWGIWSATGFLNLAADVIARVVYMTRAGTTTEMVAEHLRPIVIGTMGVTMVLGVVSAATLFLTFFPTAGYRRWLEARASAAR
jgi:hypothetical protein